ncbi:Gfo/Idh/MocA family protein [Halobacterium jilantaiense]|uniref:Predicted dehydrogenase n=1 Tax=Halobacterium jilantaiense TaxID=355548 RepID=A0A1I0MV03_9EURY|nr:Gfo/Idh/MocA family oxidoreductase [Halobacterium jilantaiense]SEV91850.1 Predicted dehydrogenase [Halobacterium jilantaiense]
MRVLVAGVGSIGRRHLRLLREHQEVTDIVAYRRSVVGDIDGVNEFDDIDEVLDLDPDVAFITNPTHLHVKTAIRCARAGCDIFIEKPLSNDREGVDELCSLAVERDLVTMVGCQLRFTPILDFVNELIANKELGSVLSFEAYSGSYLPDWRPNQDYRESYSADPDAGGGAVLDLIHEIDYTHWLFGPFDEICGRVGRVSSLKIDSEDTALMTLRSNQVLGSIHVDYCRPVPRRTLEVVFDEGVVTADFIEQTVTVEGRDGGKKESFNYERDEIFRRQLNHFFKSVDQRKSTFNDVQEGKEVLNLALKAKSSHR